MKITKSQLRKIINEEIEGALNESLLNFGLGVKGAKDTANWARQQRQKSYGSSPKKKTFMQGAEEDAQDLAGEIGGILSRDSPLMGPVDEDIKDGFIQASEAIAHMEKGQSEWGSNERDRSGKLLMRMIKQIGLLSSGGLHPEVLKKQGEEYKESRSRLVKVFPLLDDLLPVVEEANEYAPKMPQRFISKGNLEERA